MTAKQLCKTVWEELTGAGEQRRMAERVGRQVTDQTLREAVRIIRRHYLHHQPGSSPDYDKGYGDAILDMTHLLDPDTE